MYLSHLSYKHGVYPSLRNELSSKGQSSFYSVQGEVTVLLPEKDSGKLQMTAASMHAAYQISSSAPYLAAFLLIRRNDCAVFLIAVTHGAVLRQPPVQFQFEKVTQINHVRHFNVWNISPELALDNGLCVCCDVILRN